MSGGGGLRGLEPNSVKLTFLRGKIPVNDPSWQVQIAEEFLSDHSPAPPLTFTSTTTPLPPPPCLSTLTLLRNLIWLVN